MHGNLFYEDKIFFKTKNTRILLIKKLYGLTEILPIF